MKPQQLTLLPASPVWSRLVGLLPSSSLKRGVTVLAGGNILAQSLSLITAPIMTRIYRPEDYGILAVLTSVYLLLAVPTTLRYEYAITLPKEDVEAQDLVAVTLLLAGGTTIFFGGMVWLLSGWLFMRLGVPRASGYWWYIPAAVFCSAVYQSFYYFVLRQKRYGSLTKTRLSQRMVGAVVSIGMGLVRGDVLGLLLGSFLESSVGVLRLGKIALRGFARRIDHSLLPRLRAALVRYRKFALFTSGAALFNSMGSQLPPLLLAAMYGEKVTGQFAMAFRVVTLPFGLIGMAVAQVFLAEAGQLVRERPAEVPAFFGRITRKMAGMAALILLGALLCPLVFPIAFGERWRAAGVFAAVLSTYCAAMVVVSPISNIAILMKRQDIQFGLDALRAGFVFLSFWLPSRLGWSALAAVSVYSAGMTLLYGVYYLFYRRLAASCRARREA